jgi:nucleoside-diphosphate-sugar epimerase
MHVVIVGASGNVGTSLLRALADEPAVDSVLGLARRRPRREFEKTTWATADVTRDELAPHLRGADVVVHLAWAIQPSHDEGELRRVNVRGSERVFRAVADAGVPALVYASSVGAYSPGPKDRAVDESWPTDGIRTSFYSRHKAETERMLDRFEREVDGVRVVRLRPALIFKREAATGIRRLFAGPLFPSPVVRGGRLPVVPDVRGLRVQAVHSLDVGDAYRRAIVGDARGAFNIAADPVLDPAVLAAAFGARRIRMAPKLARALTDLTWRLHLQPTPVGWFDLGLGVPVLDCTRARRLLGWEPRRTSLEALRELLQGLADRAGADTPPLSPETTAPLRVRELLTGVGRSSGE